MDLIQGYVEPDLNKMSNDELIGLVHRVINLIENDRELSEGIFNYTSLEMTEFLRKIRLALSASTRSKRDMIDLVEALYGDPNMRELYESSKNATSQPLHKRRRVGGSRRRRRCTRRRLRRLRRR